MKSSNLHNTSNKGMSKKSYEGLVQYSGKVYCVTVPNHVIFVRRGGIPVWCGNSLRFYTSGIPIKYDLEANKAIRKAEKLSYETCEVCGKPGKCNEEGWLSVKCDECRSNNAKR